MKPIIFSSEMVRAILDGRKTQTRRVIKPQPILSTVALGSPSVQERQSLELAWLVGNKCPYGRPGDRLWVRETWCQFPPDAPDGMGEAVYYRASQRDQESSSAIMQLNGTSWRSSIFMPRWASRITLRVTDVRVERVRDIGIYGVANEGLEIDGLIAGFEVESDYEEGDNPDEFYDAARAAFKPVWDSINAKRGFGWDNNPWVWVVNFEQVL